MRLSRGVKEWRRARAAARRVGPWLAFVVLAAGLPGCSGLGPATTRQGLHRLQAQASYERGLNHLRDREPSQALGAFREAVLFDDGIPLYQNALGLLLLELGRPDAALGPLHRALALDPGYADAHLNLGVSLAELGRWAEAAPRYRKALSLPTLSSRGAAHQNLGLALYHLGEYPEAERELRFAIVLDPRMEAAFYNLGLVLAATGRPADAAGAFRRVQHIAPKSPFSQAASDQLRRLGGGG